MSRKTRLNKALTVALYSECGTMTIETQVTNEKEYDNISYLSHELKTRAVSTTLLTVQIMKLKYPWQKQNTHESSLLKVKVKL